MKQLLLLTFLCLLALGQRAKAQAPAWQVAVSTTNALAITIAAAPNGDAYVAGSFTGTATFGSTVLTSAGTDDMFVAKWSKASQSFVWAKRAGGNDLDSSADIVVQGNAIYLCGRFSSQTATFDGITLTRDGGADICVAKLVDAGTSASFVWAQRAGGRESEQASDIDVFGNELYITGFFSGPTLPIGTTVLTNAGTVGSSDVFIAKYLDTGSGANFVWAKQAGGINADLPSDLVVQEQVVYVAGEFHGPSASFGPTTFSTTGSYDTNMFVTKLDDTGNFLWTQRAGGSSTGGGALAVQGSNVYLSGYFAGPTATFSNSSVTLTKVSPSSSADVFVAKLVDAGISSTFSWVKQLAGAGNIFASSIAAIGSTLYLTGQFSGQIPFGATTLTSQNASTDVFVARLLDTGSTATVGWVIQGGGTGGDNAFQLSMSGTTAYITGWITPPATFGTFVLPGFYYGGFFAAVAETTLTATAPAMPDAGVTLHPNPARGSAVVKVAALRQAGLAVLTLHDAVGRVVLTRTSTLPAGDSACELSLATVPSGVYVLRVQVGNSLVTRRLTVE